MTEPDPHHGHPTVTNLTAVGIALVVAAAVILWAPTAPQPTVGTVMADPSSCGTTPPPTSSTPAATLPPAPAAAPAPGIGGGGGPQPTLLSRPPPPPPPPTTHPPAPVPPPPRVLPVPNPGEVADNILDHLTDRGIPVPPSTPGGPGGGR